jgi:transposase
MTHTATPEASYPNESILYMAMELSKKTWRLAFSDGGRRISHASVVSGARERLHGKIETFRKRFKLPADTTVVSCHEAGRDGFWVHRLLSEMGVQNQVIDAASMKVDRKARRAKSDKLDVRQLLGDLVRHHRGDRDVWAVVRVPSEEEEDQRRLHRALERLKKERAQHRTRIRSLLATQMVSPDNLNAFLAKLDTKTIWNGQPLPFYLKQEIDREHQRLKLVQSQMAEIAQERKDRLKEPTTDAEKKIQELSRLRGIGVDSAWLLVMELFGWRQFNNRKEVGGAVGLGGTPYDTGQSTREQGISKAGNSRVRSRMVELAWLWFRYQPRSDLTLWYRKRFAATKVSRKIGAVAVARRLLIQLWHFVEHGVLPGGAEFKAA